MPGGTNIFYPRNKVSNGKGAMGYPKSCWNNTHIRIVELSRGTGIIQDIEFALVNELGLGRKLARCRQGWASKETPSQ